MSVLWESVVLLIFYFCDIDVSIYICNNYYFKFLDKKNYEYFR